MKILFGNKYYGQDTSEVPSSFLIWVIEEYERAEWLLTSACKEELSARLKLDWSALNEREQDLIAQAAMSNSLNTKLLKRVDQLEKLLCMSISCKGNPYTLEMYLQNPELLEQNIKLIKQLNHDRHS